MESKKYKLVETFENASQLQLYQDKIDNNLNLKFQDISYNIENTIEEGFNNIDNTNNLDNTDNIVDNNKHLNRLNLLKNNIDAMDVSQHMEICKILKKNNIFLNENNNGIFVNLNTIGENIIIELENYIFFIKKQSELIKLDENKKIEIENIYFKNT